MKTARTRDVEESEGEIGTLGPSGWSWCFCGFRCFRTQVTHRIVFVAVTRSILHGYWNILWNIYVYQQRIFMFLPGIWLIGNDKIRFFVDWWLRHWGKLGNPWTGHGHLYISIQTKIIAKHWEDFLKQAMLEAIRGYACCIYDYLCIYYMFCTYCVCVCVSLYPSLSLSLVAYTYYV